MRSQTPSLSAALAIIAAAGLLTVTPAVSAQSGRLGFGASDCPVAVPDSPSIDCGYLTVPEDHSDPEGATIELPVIVIHSRSAHPAPDPILFTAGGPGDSSLGSVGWLAQSDLVEDRDVIILEQRGTLYARPNLMCESSVWWVESTGGTPCLDRLRQQGIDLTHYTTQQVVADIEALRQALDIGKWNLYGKSYSTRLMLLTMQQHPEPVRSVMLDSILPPNDTPYAHDPEHPARALGRLFDDCAADPACVEAYPDLESRFYQLYSRLNAEPITFTIDHDEHGLPLEEPIAEEVTGYDLLQWMVSDAFYGPAYGSGKTRYLPLLIDRVEAGNTELLQPWLADNLLRVSLSSSGFALGLHFAVNCQNDFPLIAPGEVQTQAAAYPELEGYVRHAREIEICTLWDLPAAPLNSEPVRGDIPTLVLAGGYDPVTPPAWGRMTAEALSNGYYYEFAAAGHVVADQSNCARQIQTAFLRNPGSTPDGGCIAEEPGPEFVLPKEVLIAPGFHRSIYDIDVGTPRGKPWVEAVSVGGIVLFLVEIGFLVVSGITGLVRRRGRHVQISVIAKVAHPVAGLAAALGISIMPLMSYVNRQASHSDPALLRFGLPATYAPATLLGIVAPVFAILTGVLVIFAVVAWIRGTWSLPRRVLFTLVTLVAAILTPLLVRWDLVTLLL